MPEGLKIPKDRPPIEAMIFGLFAWVLLAPIILTGKAFEEIKAIKNKIEMLKKPREKTKNKQ